MSNFSSRLADGTNPGFSLAVAEFDRDDTTKPQPYRTLAEAAAHYRATRPTPQTYCEDTRATTPIDPNHIAKLRAYHSVKDNEITKVERE